MKKLGSLGIALACLGVLLGCFLITEPPLTETPPSSRGTTRPEAPVSDADRGRQPAIRGTGPDTAAASSPAFSAAGASGPFAHRIGDEAVTAAGTKYPLRTYHALALPDDPEASQPWVSTANIDGVWDTPSGESPSLLAIIDTGFALQHEEFAGRWYANAQEQLNGIDDDGNGLADDVRGWDFAHGDNSVQAQAQGRHGTYVAGVAAATGNNGKGIAGVDWTATILPLQALGEDGTGYNVDVANAIAYAADKEADVISLSLGSDEPDGLVREAAQYAIARGSMVVAAAGNDGCNCMVYPANYPEVVAVGASYDNGQPANFSSYGANLDVLAPGVNLYTTDWQPGSPTAAYVGGISGTSLATPVVSGLLSRLKSMRPEATPIQLTAALTENTDRLSLGASFSRTDQLGFGLTDGGRASLRLLTAYSPAQLQTFTPVSFGQTLSSQSPAEKAVGTAKAYRCESSRPGTTPLYGLSKPNQEFFSTSQSEAQQAIAQGYAVGIFGYACITLPHDAPGQTTFLISLHKNPGNLNP